MQFTSIIYLRNNLQHTSPCKRVAALARTSPQIRRPFKFTPGQTYIYEYRGRQWNGIAKLADQYAGLTLDCDVILQAQRDGSGKEILMKLDDIKVEQLHTQALTSNDIRKLNQGKEVNPRQQNLYKSELAKPIRFTYVDGKVVRFVAEASDPEWSINIKKSILSLFQLDLAPTKIIKSQGKQMAEQRYGYVSEQVLSNPSTEMPLVYPIYEESFGGICETLYEIDSNDNLERRQQQEYVEINDVLNITKTVNYKNCLTDPSVSYDRHSFNVNTQTVKGKLFASQIPSVAGTNYNYVPEELKQKYSNAYTAADSSSNVAGSPIPVERHSYTKYNITTAPQSLVQRRTVPVSSPADMSLIEGIYSEGKIKYQADGDTLVSDTQQSLKLISCAPTSELARVAPEVSALSQVDVRQPQLQYETIQCELSAQKVKFYQALFKFASLQKSLHTQPQSTATTGALYSHQLALPFALSASWFPIVAGDQADQATLERMVDPEPLAKSFEHVLVALADDVLAEDVAQSKMAGEKVVRLVNIIAFMPKYKLAEVYERIVNHIQQAKQQQIQSRAKQAIVDNDEVAKWKIVRKLYLDSLPLAGSKQSIEMIELLIQNSRVQPFEAREMVEAVPANLRYPDTEIIDAFIRISQLPQVRKSRSLFASCSIACGKMIGQAYAKSKDASYKPTTNVDSKLPVQLEQADDIVKQVVEEADPRRQLPLNWASQQQEQQYERLVLDEQDITKYVRFFKSMLEKTSQYHEKVIYLETLAHMKVPQVLPILEPFVTGRLSLAQCLGQQPLDILSRGADQQQYYNYYGQQQQQRSADSKDWTEEQSFAAEECNYMRTIAIYALAHVARTSPGKVQTMLLPVFDNTYEPYQIRIAAFTTMILAPIDEHVLERIASQMWREPNKEVASFVVGTIDTMSKFTSPSMAPWKYAATKAADSMPKQYLDTWKYSWAAGGDHFNYQRDTGLIWFAEIIKSNVSSIPRAAYAHIGRFHGPAGSKFDNHLEMGFTSKGLESLIKEYINYNKQQQTTGNHETNILASIFENLYEAKDDLVKFYREARDSLKSSMLTGTTGSQEEKLFSQNFFFKRQQPIEGVNTEAGKLARKTSDLFEGATRSKRSVTFQARSSQNTDEDEEAKLTLFTKIFDSTQYHSLDKKQILNLFEQADDYIKSLGEELIMGGKLHYVKMIMPSNMWHMVPSQLGLPVVCTHRSPIVVSLKLDASQNGQLTSNKMSQYLRQQATGAQVPNTVGQNFVTMQGLNITAMVHPKIMHSEMRFMFAADQANNEAYGVQVEKSHQVSLPMELSVAYSQPKQLVSMSIEPKTPNRFSWVKECAKTFIGQLSLAGPTSLGASWLGQEHLIRVPSKESNLKNTERPASFSPTLLTSVQDLLNEPKQKQLEAIDELETPYQFDRRSPAKELGLEFLIEGATDDVDVHRSMSKRELSQQSRGQLQWSSTETVDSLDQHSKSGPFAQFLHVIESTNNRPTKYMEFYGTLRPDTTSASQRSPCYRFDFVLSGNVNTNKHQSPISGLGRRPSVNSLDVQSSKMWNAIEQGKKFKLASQYVDQQQQPIMVEGY